MTGKKKPDDLTPEQRAQLEQPLRKVASPATKEAQEPRDTTDADEQRSKKGKDEVVGRFKVYAGERASQTQDERHC